MFRNEKCMNDRKVPVYLGYKIPVKLVNLLFNNIY